MEGIVGVTAVAGQARQVQLAMTKRARSARSISKGVT